MDLGGEEGLPMHDVYREKKSVTVTTLNKPKTKRTFLNVK